MNFCIVENIVPEGDINYMFDVQRDLNTEYENGWRERPMTDYLANALHEFYGEFWKELEGLWKYFGKCPVYREKAVFELVDTVCFMTSAIILKLDDQWNSEMTRVFNLPAEKDTTQDLLLRLGRQLTNIHGTRFDKTDFQIWLSTCLYLIDVTPEQFMNAYNLKVERNRHRARNGAMDGTYDKSKETELKIDLG